MVPTLIKPPSAAPFAEVTEPEARLIVLPCRVILPPLALLLVTCGLALLLLYCAKPPLADTVPAWVIVSATRATVPPEVLTLLAEIVPVLLITDPRKSDAEFAAMMI